MSAALKIPSSVPTSTPVHVTSSNRQHPPSSLPHSEFETNLNLPDGGVNVDFEQILYQALVNEGKHIRVLKSKRPSFTYNEKQLRDAAAAEVALQCQGPEEENEKGSRKRKQLSNEEKSQQNRDRNREHAKNTRLRKKAYVSKLKELVDQLTHQKCAEVKDRISLGKKIYDTQALRKNAVNLFLTYRAANVQDASKWLSIIDERCVFTQPITPFLSFNKADVVNSQRVMKGIDAILADTAAFSLMAESIGFGTPAWTESLINTGQGCRIWYEVGKKREIISAGDLVVCRYYLKSDSSPQSVRSPVSLDQQGMVQFKFNKANKIISIEMIFDVMGFMQQYQRAAMLTPEASVVPNTLEMAHQYSNEARLVCRLQTPYCVISANENWWTLNGSTSIPNNSDYADQTLQHVLQDFNRFPSNVVDHIIFSLSRVARGIPIRVPFISSMSGQKSFYYLRIVPLANENLDLSFALLTLSEVPHSSSHILASMPDDTIINNNSPHPPNSTIPMTLPTSGWDLLRKAPFPQLTERSSGFDQSMFSLSLQHGSSPLIDPVWGGTLPFLPSQVMDPSFRSQFPQHLGPSPPLVVLPPSLSTTTITTPTTCSPSLVPSPANANVNVNANVNSTSTARVQSVVHSLPSSSLPPRPL